MLFVPAIGGLVLEVSKDAVLEGKAFTQIGETNFDSALLYKYEKNCVEDLYSVWTSPLDSIFPEFVHENGSAIKSVYDKGCFSTTRNRVAKPKVFVPVFPGTNCEYDTISAFERAGAHVESIVLKNLTPSDIAESIDAFEKAILSSQIIAL
ncbi:phosphoribosylformylglycinamidine synthase, partial [Aduncisulcus paluster]